MEEQLLKKILAAKQSLLELERQLPESQPQYVAALTRYDMLLYENAVTEQDVMYEHEMIEAAKAAERAPEAI